MEAKPTTNLEARTASSIPPTPSPPAPAKPSTKSTTTPGGKAKPQLPVVDERLLALKANVDSCELCPSLSATRIQAILGEGRLQPVILFLGEAPNDEEDKSSRLLVGEVGILFDRMLVACNLGRADVYVANLLKCRLPAARNSKPEECSNCRPWLEEQIRILEPKAICCLGEFVATRFLGTQEGMTELRAKTSTYGNIPVFTTHHPRELNKNQSLKKEAWLDLQRMLKELGREIAKT
jgi:DNA polymerase